MPAKHPNRISELRQARGWSMEDLAQRAGTTASQINKLEKRMVGLTYDWMVRVAEALACTPFELVDAPPPPPPPLPARQKALLDLLAGLSPEDQERFLKVADATAHALAEPADKRNSNDG